MSKLKVNSIESLTSGKISISGASVVTGTAASPSLNFGDDTDSGFFGNGSNTVGISSGGSVKFQTNESGALISGTLGVSGNVTLGGALTLSSSSGTGVNGTIWLT